MSLLTPNYMYENVQSIDIKKLKKDKIRGICMDMDNTIVSIIDNEVSEEVKEFIKKLKENDFKICLVTNNPDKSRIEKVAKELDVPYIRFALKPLSRGFLKAKRIFKMRKLKKMAAVGDQIFTDILGANLLGMCSIYVKPISIKDHLINRIRRPLEEKMVQRAKKKKNIMQKC